MIVVSWNINSIRKRIGLILEFLDANIVDVLLLQEIKCSENEFPVLEFMGLGYNVEVFGEKSYNGVACISKFKPKSVNCSFIEHDKQARYMELIVNVNEIDFRIINVYVPNGREINSDSYQYKKLFLKKLEEKIISNIYKGPMIIAGDYNVAPFDVDTHASQELIDSVCYHIDVRRQMRLLMSYGMKDAFRLVNKEKQEFSWWDYRGRGYEKNNGLRIDNILVSPSAVDFLEDAYIDPKWRAKKEPSDHAPVVVKFNC